MKKAVLCILGVGLVAGFLILNSHQTNVRAERYNRIQIALPEEAGIYPIEVNGMPCLYFRGSSNAAVSCNWDHDERR